MKRLRIMFDAAWPTILIMVAVTMFGLWRGAQFPDAWGSKPEAVGWEDFGLFFLAVIFLMIKSTLMLRRMGRPFDWLTIALVATNFAFASLYGLVMAGVLFPVWFATNPELADRITTGLRFGMIASLVLGIWLLTNTTDPDDEDMH